MRFYDLHFPRAIHPYTIRIPPGIYLTQEVDLNRIFKSKHPPIHPGYYIGVVLLRLAAGKAHKDGTGFCCGAGGALFSTSSNMCSSKMDETAKIMPENRWIHNRKSPLALTHGSSTYRQIAYPHGC